MFAYSIKNFINYFKISKNVITEMHGTYLYFRPFIWFIFINEFIFDFYLLEGESMLPTFDAYGNIVIVEKISTNLFLRKFMNGYVKGKSCEINTPYQKGEIVCVINPSDSDMKICKRIIYLEGEEVTLRNGNVIVVPKNHLWVEGDNKENSMDSRRFGPVPKQLVVGRVPIQIWPKIKIL
jgi:signal peptidase I